MTWTKNPKYRIAKLVSTAIVVGAIGLAAAPAIYAATAAGTVIRNLATVTYTDASGNIFSVQSNEAIVTVAQVYSATLGVDVDVTAAPGQTVYLPYVLTNTGNGEDTFDLSAINGITGGHSLDASSITIYHDVNGNGEPDANETAVTSVTLQGSQNNIANLVVAVGVPSNAAADQTIGVTLTAQAQSGGTASVVSDLSVGAGRDGLDGTNESLITITDDAVLVTTKSSVHNAAAKEITYTLTVKNLGNTAANNVVLFDGLPANTVFKEVSASGILASNGDTVAASGVLDEAALSIDFNADGDTSDSSEAALALDLNTDGDTADSAIVGVYAVDAFLSPQGTASITFTVSYDPSALGAGYVVRNQGYSSGDTNGDNQADTVRSSNVRQDVVNADYGVSLSDTGIGADDALNDGGDDDSVINNDQHVAQVSVGEQVIFNTNLTNNGNDADTFELSIISDSFPQGTVFTFYDASGTVQLFDSNGTGVDTGPVPAGTPGNPQSTTIVIKAQLPAGFSDSPANDYQAVVEVVSANDPSVNPASDTTTISLGEIIFASSDLHTAADGVLGSDESPLGTAPYDTTISIVAEAEETITIPLYIDNEGGNPDSYQLNAGTLFDGTTLSAFPAGWTVEFFVGDGSGAPTGAPITSTLVLQGGVLNYEVIAVITLSSDHAQTLSDYAFDNDGDGNPDILDANDDGDGDYPIFFQILSQNTGSNDAVLISVDIEAIRELDIFSSNSGPVEAGGSATYGYTIVNNGNTDEIVQITASNSAGGWNSSLGIDTDGDGIADTPLGNLAPGPIDVLQSNGEIAVVIAIDSDGDGVVDQFLIPPGVSLVIEAVVSAPADAQVGDTDTFTLVISNADPDSDSPDVSISVTSTVSNGSVRITKSVAADLNCDGQPDNAFVAVQETAVAPGQCAIWQVLAENNSSAEATNVIVSDAIPSFSSYVANSLAYCLSGSCVVESMTDGVDGDRGQIIGNNIVFYIGTNANPAIGEGGLMIPGQQATAQFRVIVD